MCHRILHTRVQNSGRSAVFNLEHLFMCSIVYAKQWILFQKIEKSQKFLDFIPKILYLCVG